jgi:hypothetical protein
VTPAKPGKTRRWPASGDTSIRGGETAGREGAKEREEEAKKERISIITQLALETISTSYLHFSTFYLHF